MSGLLVFLLSLIPWPAVGIEPAWAIEVIDNTQLLKVELPTCTVGAVLMFTGKDGGPVTACHVGKMIEEKPGACAGSMMSASEKRAVREVWAKEVYRLCTLKEYIRMHASEFPGFQRL